MFPVITLRQRVILFTTFRLTLNTSIRMVYPFIAVFAASLNKEVGMISLALAASMATSALGPFIAPIADRPSDPAFGIAGVHRNSDNDR